MYWIAFLSTWLVFPLLTSYVCAGEFEVEERIMTSLRENVIVNLVMLVAGMSIFQLVSLSNKSCYVSWKLTREMEALIFVYFVVL